jgi:DNA-binding CsgD family transcriptional regulator
MAEQRSEEAGGSLTAREREVLQLVEERRSNREIASALGIRRITVKTHLSSVFRKLGVEGRDRAAAVGVSNGLVEPDVRDYCRPFGGWRTGTNQGDTGDTTPEQPPLPGEPVRPPLGGAGERGPGQRSLRESGGLR